MAATMLGQGKNAWQAEIDAAAEVRLPPGARRLAPTTARLYGGKADLDRCCPFLSSLPQMVDFFRFGVKFVDQMYAIQPAENSPGVWK